jgi:hypothetical protein
LNLPIGWAAGQTEKYFVKTVASWKTVCTALPPLSAVMVVQIAQLDASK